MTIKEFFLLIVVFLNLILFFLTIKRSWYREQRFFLSLFALALASWSFGMYMYIKEPPKADRVLPWVRFLYSMGIVAFSSLLAFSLNFPKVLKNKGLSWFLFFLPILFLIPLITFSNYIVSGIKFYPDNRQVTHGSLYWLFFSLYFFYVSLAVIKTYLDYRHYKGILKYQLKYILIGFLTAVLFAGIINLILPAFWGNFRYAPFGPILLLIFLYCIYYSIFKYRLINYRLIFQKSLIFSLILLLGFLLFSILFLILSNLFTEITGINYFWTVIISSGIIILSYKYFEIKFKNLTDKYFFKGLYNYQKISKEIFEKIPFITNSKILNETIVNDLSNLFKLKKVALLTFNKDKNCFLFVAGKINHDKEICLDFNDPLILYFQKGQNKILIRDEIEYDALYRGRRGEILKQLEKLDFQIVIPIEVKRKIFALLFLGQKLSNEIFYREDIEFLLLLAAQLSIVFDHILLYENLENEVADRTWELSVANAQLQRLNKQLQEINEAKSEFVSIASHQLKTPLTVIKGIISMLLSGDFGKLGKTPKLYLFKAFANTEKMIKLINSLLNISKIETGKTLLKISQFDLNKLIEEAIGEFKGLATKKDIKINFKKTKVPLIKADKEQIKQVILNLLDNAIKYTPKGKIDIWTEEEKDGVIFKIKDTGLGMTKDEIKGLFEKFIRGKSGEKLYAGGTGLGLYAARRIIEVHGGRIWAKSEGPGKGSLFAFSLPLE